MDLAGDDRILGVELTRFKDCLIDLDLFESFSCSLFISALISISFFEVL